MRQQMMPRAKRLEVARIVAARRGKTFFMVQIYRLPVAIGHAAATAVLLPQNASDFYGDISGDWFAGKWFLVCLPQRQFVFFLRDFPPPPLQRATQKDIDVDAFGL